MTETAEAPPAAATQALVERLFGATIDTLEIASVHLGGRLGFYRALADGGAATPGELAARVRPAVLDASAPDLGGPYDLVTIFEALHDMNHPVDALRAVRANLAEGGSVLIADERVAERFNAPGDEIERFNYGWSVLHCLAVGALDADSAGTGTVIRPDTVRAYAAEAGFGRSTCSR